MKLNYILAILALVGVTSSASSAISDIIIADSVKDFSMIQGENRWYYGFYDGDTSTPYTNSDFEEFPKHGINMHGTQEWYIEHFWHEKRIWSSLWATGGHPHGNPGHWIVRRWHSSYEGPVQITGKLAKIQTNCGDGISGHIIIDGKEVWSKELDYNDGEGVNYTVNADVKVHSLIDFAISPKTSNQHCDGTTFTAVIKPKAPQNNIPETISNTMEIISVDPPLPAKLKLGEKLHVKIRYDLDDFDSVHIWARPYTNGKSTSGYAAHPSPSYQKSNSKTGIAEGWFYFDRPTLVDEIRVNMKDASGKEKTITKKIDAKWISNRTGQSPYFPHTASFNGHYYKVMRHRLTWKEAQEVCEAAGGYLACITSPEENDFIHNLAKKHPYPSGTCCWIGGTKNAETGRWGWVSKEPLEMQDYIEDQNMGEYFLNLRLQKGIWEDYPNRGELSGEQWFVCEWSSPDSIRLEALPNKPAPQKPRKSNLQEISIGEPFPKLEFKDLNGKVVNIADLKGKVVLIDFWATWCGPCRAETPNLLAVYKDYKDKGLEIIGINLDKDKQRLTDYLEEHQIPWPNYFDGKGWDNEISRRFGVSGIPKILLIDDKGIVQEAGLRGDRIREAVEGAIRLIGKSPDSLEASPIVTSEYTIKEGDSLWKIAENELGDGNRYKEIAQLNPQLKQDMRVGNKLIIPVHEQEFD